MAPMGNPTRSDGDRDRPVPTARAGVPPRVAETGPGTSPSPLRPEGSRDLPPALAAARALVSELWVQGVRDVVLAPGSRSAPLAYVLAAAASAGAVRLHVRVDERSAGFLALGLAKGSAPLTRGTGSDDGPAVQVPRPVAVVTTSGTAVVNLHPAVLEAHHTGVPLVLLTADRPHELRGTGASQTTEQVGIFGRAVRYAVDVPAPDGRVGEVRDLLAVTGRALAAALGLRDRNPGPVHLNLAYREPLHPPVGATPPRHPARGEGPSASSCAQGALRLADARAAQAPRPESQDPDQPSSLGPATPLRSAQDDGGPLHEPLWPAETREVAGFRGTTVVPPAPGPGADPVLPGDPARTVVVAGDRAGADARRLAEAQGWPLLAEPSSGACGGPNAVQGYRAVLGAAELAGEVEQVVVLGHPTLSRPVQRLLARPDVAVTVVAPGGGPWPDAARNAAAVVGRLDDRWLTEPQHPGNRPFLERWQAASAAAAEVLAAATGAPVREFGHPGLLRSSGLPKTDRMTEPAGEGAPAAATHADSGPARVEPSALAVARVVAAATGPHDVLVVGSSNPVRDLDLVLGLDLAPEAPPPAVVANRGLAGIDGVVATATGVALTRPAGVTRALLGDLTFLHDVGGLLRGPAEPGCDLQLVVVNDDGGSIFATLEHGEVAAASDAGAAAFERVFATPHGADLAALCAGYGVGHRRVTDLASLRVALAAPAGGVEVVEVRVPRSGRLVESRAVHDEIATAARAASGGAASGGPDRQNER